MNKKIKFLKFQLGTAILVLVTVLVSGFFIFGPELSQVARALGNYSKVTGDSLTIVDWNNLDNDFVAKSGDTMLGPLTLSGAPTQPNQAATKQYVDNNLGGNFVDVAGDTMTGFLTLSADPVQPLQAATKQYVDANGGGSNYVDVSGLVSGDLNMQGNQITNLGAPGADGDAVSRGVMNTAIAGAIAGIGSDIRDTSGGGLRMVCGRTYLNIVNTVQYSTESFGHIRVEIDTSSIGFTDVPYYFASLGGSYVYGTYGVSNVYPSINNFRVVLTFIGDNRDGIVPASWGGGYLTPAKAIDFGGWYIDWCAIGQ